jgi:Ni/Co efflux regulator RcnB
MKKLMIALAAAGLAVTAAPAAADPPSWAPAYGQRDRYDRDDRRYDRGDRYERRYDRRDRYERRSVYDRQGRYYEPRRLSRRDNMWRGRDGRYYCERDNGTTGLIIGAAGGAFLGRAVDTRGERTTGTILGAALGALIGRELDRGELRCR